ncbi:MAG TPA: helicase-related protein [Rhizomicrobium sp.]|jgi:ATP-dependent RNA helicase SUPV3L1/SUV3|nr:helicase-related protein [Rhizomicrobium sp.]
MTARQSARGAIRPREMNRVGAVLGPTNTGKTYFAIERMLAHRSGMIGLPLRLLAREVYEKIVRIKGAGVTALVTGEEKIVPKGAQYFVCTVEAMPLDLRTAFLAVDEIQLCADAERGHVFTDRLLHARGEEETLLLGAETMRPAIQRFVPEAHFITRTRFSDLAFTGHKKLTRLPRRAALVAFSAEDVYGIAELIRRQRGGAAVVLGALSPRTRNAQVALYQSGEVDFLVATDAIGMGLNMDIDHVAFAALEKFDGVGIRPLRADELGQIAGRAGRHMNDGTFGVTADCTTPDEEMLGRIEAHRYEPVRQLQWRNTALGFRSLGDLLETLDEPPPQRGLVRARPAMDVSALRVLSASDEITRLAKSPAAVKLLWEVCQLPDFRKLSVEDHARLVQQIYLHLIGPEAALPEDWIARHVARVDEVEGDVATLSGRLAQIRTWTYAAHRPGWVRDASHWQEQTRAVEDRLSDALHERLTLRFIDRRTSLFLRSLREDEPLSLTLDESGAALVGGEVIGKLEGFQFAPDPRAEGARTLRAIAAKALESEYFTRAQRLSGADDAAFNLSEHGRVWWEGAIIARLARGIAALEPDIALVCDDQLKPELRDLILARLRSWLSARIGDRLVPLQALRAAADAKPGSPGALAPEARGIAHQLCEELGSLDLQTAVLPQDIRPARFALRRFGVVFGRRSIFLPQLLRPQAASLLALLSAVWAGLEAIPPAPLPGLTSFEAEDWIPDAFLVAAGYRRLARRAVRLDMVERVEGALDGAVRSGATSATLTQQLLSLLGINATELDLILPALGWRQVAVGEGDSVTHVWRRQPVQRPARKEKSQRKSPLPKRDSPFAGVATLIPAD